MELQFETPPEPKRAFGPRTSKFEPWLRQLRDHPDQWCKYPERVPSSIASAIKKGRLGAGKANAYQAVVRNTDKNSKGDLYVRYLG